MVKTVLALFEVPLVETILLELLDPIGNLRDAIAFAGASRMHYIILMAKWMKLWDEYKKNQNAFLAKMFYMLLEILRFPMREIGSLFRPVHEMPGDEEASMFVAACQFVLWILIYFFPRITDLRTPVWKHFFEHHVSTRGVFGAAAFRNSFGQEHIRVLGVLLSRIRRRPAGPSSPFHHTIYDHALHHQRLELELAVSRSVNWEWDDNVFYAMRCQQWNMHALFLEDLPSEVYVPSRSYLDTCTTDVLDEDNWNLMIAKVDRSPGREEEPLVCEHPAVPWLSDRFRRW